jgi:hypothetical protein
MSDEATTTAAPVVETTESTESTEGNTEGEAAPKPAEPKKKVPAYRKYKVGNEEVSLTDEDIARDYSKWRGADAKARETAEARKSMEAFFERLVADPEAVLSDPRLTIDRKKLAEKWLVQQVEQEINPPDPRDEKLSAAEKKLKEYQDKEKAAQDTAEKTERDAVIAKRRTDIGNVLREAGKLTPLSASPEHEAALIREMAMYMRAAKERGDEPTAVEIAEHIHNQRFQQFYTLAHQFEGPELIDFLGDEIVNRIRKADLARLRGAREPESQHRNPDAVQRREPKERKKMDAFAAREHVKKWAST